MVISEIYEGIEGSGVRIGTLQLFVRTFGCKVKCKNCDTKYTWNSTENRKNTVEMSPKMLMDYVDKSELPWVSITGGDPLLQREEVAEFIDLCHESDKFVNIEATGLFNDSLVFSKCDFISADIKTPNTGILADPDVILDLYNSYENIQFKAVVANQEDLDYIKCYKIPVVLTPCWEPGKKLNKTFLHDVQELLKIRPNFRMIVQQHKFLFGADAKLV